MKRIFKVLGLVLSGSFPMLVMASGPPAGNYILNVSTNIAQPSFSVSSGTVNGPFYLPSLTVGQCHTTDNTGKVIGVPCGSGAASVAVTTGSASGFSSITSSPTAIINFDSSTFLTSLKGAATVYTQLNPSSVTLQGNNLSSTYLTNSSATATYLQISSATAYYMSQSSATSYFIQQSTIVSISHGGTGTSSPGLIAGTNITSITGSWPNQTINASGGGSGSFTSINASGSPLLTSSATFAAGTNITLSQSGSTITINSSGGGGGGGGGSSALAVQKNAVNVSSPTVAINFIGPPFLVNLVNGATSQIGLDGSSVTLRGTAWAAAVDASTATFLTTSSATATYLQISSATATYLQQSSATVTYQPIGSYLTTSSATATYLSQINAASTYLIASSATATYLQQSSATITYAPISGSKNYIQNTSSLQSGASFYVYDGSIVSQLGIGSGSLLDLNHSVYLGEFIGTSGGSYQVCEGYHSCTASGANDIGIGFYEFAGSNSGGSNVAIGSGNFESGKAGSNNIAIGQSAMNYQTYTGFDSVAVGHDAFEYNNNYGESTAVGAYALQYSSSGFENTAVGLNSLNSLYSGFDNTAIGNFALQTIYSGNTNVGVGHSAGGSSISPANQVNPGSGGTTFLGANSRVVSSMTVLSNATAIGYLDTVGCPNCITMGSDGNGTNYFVGIGTTTPVYTLSVVGSSGIYTSAGLKSDGVVSLSSGVLLSGSAGSSGQVLTSGGAGAVPTWTTVSGGGGGSSSALGVGTGTISGVTVLTSTPTSLINFDGNYFTTALAGTTTAYVSIVPTAFLTQSSATATYLSQINAASTYLTASSATTTYLQQSSATATYQPIGSYLTTSSATATYLQLSSATATYQPKGSYLTANQTITMSGDVTGSGATSITATNSALQPNISTLSRSSITVSGFALFNSTITLPSTQNFLQSSVGVSWDGGGSALTTGTTYWLVVPASGTISKVIMTAYPSGSFSVIVSSSSGFNISGATHICASDCPSITSGTSLTDSTLTGWTTAVAKDEFLYFVSTSAATSTQANITLEYTRQ